MAQKERNVNRDYLRKKIDEYGGISEVARKTGLPRSLVCEHYSGKRNVSFDSLIAYCNNLNLSADMFLKLPTEETEERFIDRISDYTGLSTDVIQSMHENGCSWYMGKCFDLVDFFNALWNTFSENSVLHDLNQETAIVEDEIRGTGYRIQRISSAIEQTKGNDIADLLSTLRALSEKESYKHTEDEGYILAKYLMSKINAELDIFPSFEEVDTYSLKKVERNLYGYLYEAQRLFDTTLREFCNIDGINEAKEKVGETEIYLEKTLSQFTDNSKLAGTSRDVAQGCVNILKPLNEDYQK